MRLRAAAAAMGWVACCIVGLLLVGCGGGGKSKSAYVDHLPLPAEPLVVPMDAAGQYGGRFVAGATAGPKTFNPIMANETSSNEIIQMMFISLTDIDYRTQADIPMLARSWEISPDGRTVTYHLRRGAMFSDGHPITSEDVIFGLEVIMDPVVHPSMQDGLMMESGGKTMPFTFSAPDSYTVVVQTPWLDAVVLAHVANLRIVPKHILEPLFKAGQFPSAYNTATAPESLITSGPWKLKAYAENEKTVLERNPYWFGVDAQNRRLPYLDELVFRVAKDQDVAAQMFHAGELDGLDNVKAEDYAKFEADSKTKAFVLHDIGTSYNTHFIWFNLNRVRKAEPGKKLGAPKTEAHKYAWFSNPEFRRAVSYAIDRDALIKGPYYGYGVKGWGIITQSNTPWYDSTLTAADLDRDRSKALLDKLGMKDRNGDGVREDASGRDVSFTMIFNGDNKMRSSMATLIQDDLRQVGIKLVPTGLDFNTLVAKTRSDQGYDACLLGLGSAVPSDPGMGANFWKSTGGTHYWNMKQPEGKPDTPAEQRINEAYARNLGTRDVVARKAGYHDMAQILNDEAFVIFLPTQLMRIPVSSRFGNVHPSAMPHRILWNSQVIFQSRPPKAN